MSTQNTKQKAISLLAQGISQSEVARRLGVTRQAVSYWLKSEDFKSQVEQARQDFLANQVNKKTESIPIAIPIKTDSVQFSNAGNNTYRESLRHRELALLEEIEDCLLCQLREGSTRAAGLLLKVSERRSKLLGLDQKPYEVIEALQVLIDEGCASTSQLENVSAAFQEMQEKLRHYSPTDAVESV